MQKCHLKLFIDIPINLAMPGPNTSSQHRGSVTVHLKVDPTCLAFPAALESDWAGPRTVEDLARMGVVTKVLQADLDRLGMSPSWSSLFESLATLVRLAGNIAQVSSIPRMMK